MGKAVVFGFGTAVDLAVNGRNLVIRDVSVDPPVTVSDQDLAASAVSTEVELAENTMFEATLIDTRDASGSPMSDPAVLKFNTSETFFPAPELQILSMEDTSSSSSSSSVSSSSSSSESSESSSSSSQSSSSSLNSSSSSVSSSSSSQS